LWEPSEKAVKAYIEKINEGSNGMIQSDYNVISKPKHYMLFEEQGIEVRDVIEKLTGKLELTSMGHSYMFAADYVQLMQYLMRFMDKNGKEDLEKARWYLDKMIESY
jgi:heterodisulfide reductase subunit B